MANAGVKLILLVALLSVVGVCVAHENSIDLGQLFTSPSERQALNRLRNGNLIQDDNARAVAPGVDQERVQGVSNSHDSIVVNGVMQRANGDKVVWINGKRVNGNQGPGDVRIAHGPDREGRVAVAVQNSRAVELKPGQRLQVDNGKVAENYLAGNKGAEKHEAQ